MSTFSSLTLVANLGQIRQFLTDFLADVPDFAWNHHTEPNDSGWTLWETVAHLTAVAQTWQQSMESVLAGKPPHYPGLNKRTDLPDFLARGIQARRALPPQALTDSLGQTLAQAQTRAATLDKAALALPVPMPAYNRPLTVAELIGCQIAHPGLVHAAQMTNAVGIKPLWTQYPAAFMNHVITYFMHQFSHSYWPERGGDLQASINFIVGGPGGGRWYVTMNPGGGEAGVGGVKRPSLILWARNTDAFCRAFTQQLTPWQALLRGQFLALGKVWLAFRLSELFTPT